MLVKGALDSLSSHMAGGGSEGFTLGLRFIRQASEQASPSPGTGEESLFQHSNSQPRGLQPAHASIPPCLVPCTTWSKPQPQKGEEEAWGAGVEALHGEDRGGLQTQG